MSISHTHARAHAHTEETVTVIGILQSKRVSTVQACCQEELYLDRPCQLCLLMLRLRAQEDKKRTSKEEMQTQVMAFVLHIDMLSDITNAG